MSEDVVSKAGHYSPRGIFRLPWRQAHTLGAVSLFKAASTVSLLTLASRVTGLVRDLLMASMFGANVLTDAFNVAFRIPNLFRRLFAEGAFSQAFVPVLAAHKTQHGEEATRGLVDAVAGRQRRLSDESPASGFSADQAHGLKLCINPAGRDQRQPF